ncbi:MAG TPA: PilN domain-containing protein [Candidatus Paceibacterota bacterium]|nr:PilN domain-containing protein [Candidatus Paceibacterota bacterium]
MKSTLLSLLRVQLSSAGLEVSDTSLRIAAFDGRGWKTFAVKLAPGIIEKGKIKDRAAFIAAVAELKKQMDPRHPGRRVNVAVCFGSLDVYTQVLQLPIVPEKNMEEAVMLNLRMASPIDVRDAYYSWQVVGRNENTMQLEILAAFVDRKTVDEATDALFEAGFIATSVESRGLALTRLVREKAAGVDVPKSYLFVDIDDFGIDFLIIRNGGLYFEYQNSWKDVMGEKGEITEQAFVDLFAASFRQVLNFYNQHWPEPLGAVILSAAAFQEAAEKVLAANAPFPAIRLTLVMGQPVSSEWLVVLGSGLRDQTSKTRQEINLLGAESLGRFFEERIIHFLQFWRLVVPVALGILLATFIATDVLLGNMITDSRMASNSIVSEEQRRQISSLEASAQSFNTAIGTLAAIERSVIPQGPLLQKLNAIAMTSNVTITSISYQGQGSSISIGGFASSEDGVTEFQEHMTNEPLFTDVNLPLTGIQTQGTQVSFTMTFSYSPPVRR